MATFNIRSSAQQDAITDLLAPQATTYNKTEVDDKDAVLAAETALRNFVPSVDPTISLNFAKNKSSIYGGFEVGQVEKTIFQTAADGDLTVVNGEATGFDPRGRLSYSTANKPRLVFDADTGVSQGLLVEEARTNFIPYSNNLANAIWSKRSESTVIPCDQVHPDGTLTVNKHVNTGTSLSGSYIRQSNVFTKDDTIYTMQAKVKRGSQASARLTMYSRISPSHRAVLDFNYDTKVFSAYAVNTVTDVTGSVVELPNGFFLITLSGNMMSGTDATGVEYTPSTWSTPSAPYSEHGYICDCQLEEGSFPTSYIPSTETFTSRASTATYYDSTGTLQTAAIDTARISYNPADLSAPGKLLLEGASTNLQIQSGDFSQTNWNKINVTVAPSTTLSPDGASYLQEVTVAASDAAILYDQYDPTSWVTGDLITQSYFFKKRSAHDQVRIAVNNGRLGGGRADLVIDLFDFAVISNTMVSYQIQNVGNDIYRVSGTSYYDPTLDQANNTHIYFLSDTGGAPLEGTKFLIWGAQLEELQYPTSYIPTTTAQVTRSADVSSSAQTTRVGDVTTQDLTALAGWNNKSFTLYSEFWHDSSEVPSNYYYPAMSGSSTSWTTTPRLSIRRGSPGTAEIALQLVSNAGIISQPVTSLDDKSWNKVAISICSEYVITAVNGVVTDHNTTWYRGLDFKINWLSAAKLNIRSNAIYPRALSSAECIALTS